MTEEFFAEVIAELFPRVSRAVRVSPGGFPYDENRDAAVTKGEVRLLGSTPRLRARTACITAFSRVRRGTVCASLGALHRVLPRGDISDTVEESELSAGRQTG